MVVKFLFFGILGILVDSQSKILVENIQINIASWQFGFEDERFPMAKT